MTWRDVRACILIVPFLAAAGCLALPSDTLEDGTLRVTLARDNVVVGDTVTVTVILRRSTGSLAEEGKNIELDVTAGQFTSSDLPVFRGVTAALGTMTVVLRAPGSAGEITITARSGAVLGDAKLTVRDATSTP